MVANSSHRFSSTSRCLAVAIGISLLASGRLATAGNLFVADQSLGRIYEYTPSGTQSTFFTNTSLAPIALAFNSSGDLFAGVTSTGCGYIYKFTPNGTQSIFAELNSVYLAEYALSIWTGV